MIFPEKNFFKNCLGRFSECVGIFNLLQHISTYNWPESWDKILFNYPNEIFFFPQLHINKLGWAGCTAKIEEKNLTKLNHYILKLPLTAPTISSLEFKPKAPWKVPNLKIHLSSILFNLLHFEILFFFFNNKTDFSLKNPRFCIVN